MLPNPQSHIDDRLVDLEIKASYAEDLLDQLNAVIVRQQQQIDALAQALGALRGQLAAAEPQMRRSLRDELPPHY